MSTTEHNEIMIRMIPYRNARNFLKQNCREVSAAQSINITAITVGGFYPKTFFYPTWITERQPITVRHKHTPKLKVMHISIASWVAACVSSSRVRVATQEIIPLGFNRQANRD